MKEKLKQTKIYLSDTELKALKELKQLGGHTVNHWVRQTIKEGYPAVHEQAQHTHTLNQVKNSLQKKHKTLQAEKEATAKELRDIERTKPLHTFEGMLIN